jgi:hypothetical protein
MPTFTLELWRVIDLKPDVIDEDTWLGLADYPLFEASYRQALNLKIKTHFMYQEIGHETVEQFTFSMKRRMNEIMPLYNELYKSTKLEFDPLSTMDIHTVVSGSAEQQSAATTTNETSSEVDAKSKNVASAFPQVQLSGNADYATSGADANSQTESTAEANETSNASNTSSNDQDSHTTGYQGSPAELIQRFRAAILNVDMLIIAELDVLFMGVWNNGDEYSRTNIGGYFF